MARTPFPAPSRRVDEFKNRAAKANFLVMHRAIHGAGTGLRVVSATTRNLVNSRNIEYVCDGDQAAREDRVFPPSLTARDFVLVVPE